MFPYQLYYAMHSIWCTEMKRSTNIHMRVFCRVGPSTFKEGPFKETTTSGTRYKQGHGRHLGMSWGKYIFRRREDVRVVEPTGDGAEVAYRGM